MKLYAWFPQGGRLEVRIPDGHTPESYRQWIEQKGPAWLSLTDDSIANVNQIVRLELAEPELLF